MAGTLNAEDAIAAWIALLKVDLPTKFDALDTTYSATGNEVLADIPAANYLHASREAYGNGSYLVLEGVGIEHAAVDGDKHVFQHRLLMEIILRESGKDSGGGDPGELLTKKIGRIVRGILELYDIRAASTANQTLNDGTNDNVAYLRFNGAELSELDTTNVFEKRAALEWSAFVDV
jgi:hypothetical protein